MRGVQDCKIQHRDCTAVVAKGVDIFFFFFFKLHGRRGCSLHHLAAACERRHLRGETTSYVEGGKTSRRLLFTLPERAALERTPSAMDSSDQMQ